jgi:hypothetical protein
MCVHYVCFMLLKSVHNHICVRACVCPHTCWLGVFSSQLARWQGCTYSGNITLSLLFLCLIMNYSLKTINYPDHILSFSWWYVTWPWMVSVMMIYSIWYLSTKRAWLPWHVSIMLYCPTSGPTTQNWICEISRISLLCQSCSASCERVCG